LHFRQYIHTEMAKKKKDVPLPENQPVSPEHVIALRKGLKQGQVREFSE
jgi:hypothetical protein